MTEFRLLPRITIECWPRSKESDLLLLQPVQAVRAVDSSFGVGAMSSTSIPLPPGIDATRMSQTSEVPLQTAIFHTVMLLGKPIDGASTSNSTKSMVSGLSETDAPAPKWSAALELDSWASVAGSIPKRSQDQTGKPTRFFLGSQLAHRHHARHHVCGRTSPGPRANRRLQKGISS